MTIQKEIFQKGDKSHQDSFWFEGHIATLSMKDKEGDIRSVYIYAVGDIRIYDNKSGNLVYDVKERNEGFERLPNGLKTDKDFALLEKYDYEWGNNNWFSFEYDINNGERHDFMGDFCHEYDTAIEKGIKALKDEKFWKQFKEKG